MPSAALCWQVAPLRRAAGGRALRRLHAQLATQPAQALPTLRRRARGGAFQEDTGPVPKGGAPRRAPRLPLSRAAYACITAHRWARTDCGRSGTPRVYRRLRAGERRWTWGAAGCGRSALGGSRATRPCYTAATRRARRPAAPPAAARARATATRRARLPAARQAAPQPCPASSPARRATCCLRPHCRSPRSVGLPPAAASAPAPAPMRRARRALGETRRRVRRRRRSLIKGKFAKRSARYHPTRPCASAARLSPPRSASSSRHVEASSLRGTLSFRSESVQAPRNRGRSALLCRSSCCSACSCCWQALASGPEQGEQEPAC